MIRRMVLFGVGNPGEKYHCTRHNLGFRVLDMFASKYGLEWNAGAPTYDIAEFTLASAELFLVKPITYVNLCGDALRDFRLTCEIEPGDVLAIVDDIALPLGQLRLRRQGSDGGHNGLRSIGDELGTTRFPRLRMGVGPVPPRVDPADFVLAPFGRDEEESADRLVVKAVSCVEDLVDKGFERTMSIHNATEADSESV